MLEHFSDRIFECADSAPQKVTLFVDEKLKKIFDILDSVSERKKNFCDKFSGTPYIIGEMADNFMSVIKNESGDLVAKKVINSLAGKFRGLYIDLLNNGDSHGECFNFSVRLRDIYNYAFEKLNIPKEAFLVSGRFGNETEGLSDHHWVLIVDKNLADWRPLSDFGQIGAIQLDDPANKIILNLCKSGVLVDGTVDQYKQWSGLNEEDRESLCENKVLISDLRKPDSASNFYHPRFVLKNEAIYFNSAEKKD